MLSVMITDIEKVRSLSKSQDFSQVTSCISSAVAVFWLELHFILQHSHHLVLITVQSGAMSEEEQCELMPELPRRQQATGEMDLYINISVLGNQHMEIMKA